MVWWLGGRFDDDAEAELLDLAGEAPGVGCGVGSPLEVVEAEFLVDGVVGQDVPDDDDQGVGDGERGFGLAPLAETATERWNWAAR
jgi:hypothetical protein